MPGLIRRRLACVFREWMITIAAGVAGAAVSWAACRVTVRAPRPAAVPVRCCVVVTALAWAWLGRRWSVGGLPGWWLPVPLAVFAVAAPLVAADLRYRRLPDVLTATLAALVGVALAASAFAVDAVAADSGEAGTGLVVRSVAGAVGFTVVHALVRAVSPRSMGAGDVKLAAGLGGGAGAVGWPALVVTSAVASLVTLAAAWMTRVTCRGPTGRGVPHGPGMVLGACLVVAFPGAGLDGGAGPATWAVTGSGMGVITPGPG
ncbi:leader peptidase (prepilin peptidase)/N-methyltransferase [Prauserella sediminis]|uniref:Leader peptidase (Prepilin peptidase)/N-methyltransferase n=1 Tax=Prauserella sediminis TaxID=577680 RepID=A0A839XZC3_9PSEU|nr:prepilin peptidase [Prauserella sediminis]MBB3665753.1 leader peptidase (prepilin peptidase)/N-methyltransferase [Prauserella sediminis]